MLHSPAKFFKLETAAEFQGKVIAFISDRFNTSHPQLVVLLERNTWE
jgi:hypothetical protein